jgi:arylsulfatase A-like enzyme
MASRRYRDLAWLRARYLLPLGVLILAAILLLDPSRGFQTPKFHIPFASELSQSDAAQRLRVGAVGANVIIIVTDAACADHFTSFGYKRNTTPDIARFHQDSVLFTEAYSSAASTKPSIASLFTSQFPDTHGALALPARLAAESATLAECLKSAGYRTAGFSASPSVSASFGFSRGFDSFHELFRDVGMDPAGPDLQRVSGLPVDAALVLKSVTGWLQAHKHERFFAYLHFREPHTPYVAPPSFQARVRGAERRPGLQTMYDACLAYVDSVIGKLLRDLEASGLLDKSVVVLMADHGEAFGQHGRFGHASTPYREMVHVPLAFHLPARSGAVPQRRSEVFSNTDVMPTLLDLLQIAPPKTMQGRSRLGLLAGEEEKTPAFTVSRALGEDLTGGKQDCGQISYALRVPRYTLVLADRGRRVELYDRDADPGEQHNIAGERQDLVKKLRAQFAAWAATQRGRPVVLPGGRVFAVEGKVADMDEVTRRQLRSLGYLK